MSAAVLAPLARDSDFQAAWYYSMVLFAGILLAGWGFLLVVRQLGQMWRRGDRGMAAAVAAAAGVTFLTFAAMLITVAIAMLPVAFNGGGG